MPNVVLLMRIIVVGAWAFLFMNAAISTPDSTLPGFHFCLPDFRDIQVNDQFRNEITDAP